MKSRHSNCRTRAHLFDLPLLGVRDLCESLALQSVVLFHFGGVAKVQVGGSVRVPHGDLFSFWTNVPPSVRVQIFSCVLIHILAKADKSIKVRSCKGENMSNLSWSHESIFYLPSYSDWSLSLWTTAPSLWLFDPCWQRQPHWRLVPLYAAQRCGLVPPTAS